MNKQQKITIIGIIIVVILLCIEIFYTYSLFETNVETDTSSDIAKWNIKVNNSMITESNYLIDSFNLGSIDWENSNHITSGKAAPGSVGTFEIEIDPTDTQVSFVYELTIDTSDLLNEEFEITSVTETNGNTFIRTDENKYVGIAHLNEIENGEIYNIEIEITWNNDDNNNDSDYELGIRADEELNIDVNIELSQYIGTEIFTPYEE